MQPTLECLGLPSIGMVPAHHPAALLPDMRLHSSVQLDRFACMHNCGSCVSRGCVRATCGGSLRTPCERTMISKYHHSLIRIRRIAHTTTCPGTARRMVSTRRFRVLPATTQPQAGRGPRCLSGSALKSTPSARVVSTKHRRVIPPPPRTHHGLPSLLLQHPLLLLRFFRLGHPHLRLALLLEQRCHIIACMSVVSPLRCVQ
jgi:hypothetical protein